MYWTVPAVMHYNSSVAEHWTLFSYALYVVCMYVLSVSNPAVATKSNKPLLFSYDNPCW